MEHFGNNFEKVHIVIYDWGNTAIDADDEIKMISNLLEKMGDCLEAKFFVVQFPGNIHIVNRKKIANWIFSYKYFL
jgi:hypothetical protein